MVVSHNRLGASTLNVVQKYGRKSQDDIAIFRQGQVSKPKARFQFVRNA